MSDSNVEVKRFDPVQETAARIAFGALFKPAEKRSPAEKNALRVILGNRESEAA